jgi:folylpolyglutamate synthase/dihydrofolate synthase
MPIPFADYAAFERHLDSLGLFHMDMGLGRVRRALERLGLERPPFAVAQLVGTNGKGSTAAFLAGLARARGLRVGLYTSPHFLTPRERVRVDGALLDEAAWTALANRVFEAGRTADGPAGQGGRAPHHGPTEGLPPGPCAAPHAAPRGGSSAGPGASPCALSATGNAGAAAVAASAPHSAVGSEAEAGGGAGTPAAGRAAPAPPSAFPSPARHGGHVPGCELTYFEFLTVLAVLAFAEAGVELAVMEAGLGGAHDATTALAADAVLVTRIGLDHQTVLGATVEEIARDKAGAVRAGRVALTAAQRPGVMAELALAAERAAARLVRAEYDAVADALAPGSPDFPGGPHQAGNARLALAAFNELARARHWRPYDEFDAEKLFGILERSRLPGRFQFAWREPVPVAPALGAARAARAPDLILDGAHNEDALAALGAALRGAHLAPRAVVFACLRDKNPAHLALLVPGLGRCPVHVPGLAVPERGSDPRELAALLADALRAMNAARAPGDAEPDAAGGAGGASGPGARSAARGEAAPAQGGAAASAPPPAASSALASGAAFGAAYGAASAPSAVPAPVTAHRDVAEALAAALAESGQGPVLVCGSLYLLAEFYRLRPDCLEQADLPVEVPAHFPDAP